MFNSPFTHNQNHHIVHLHIYFPASNNIQQDTLCIISAIMAVTLDPSYLIHSLYSFSTHLIHYLLTWHYFTCHQNLAFWQHNNKYHMCKLITIPNLQTNLSSYGWLCDKETSANNSGLFSKIIWQVTHRILLLAYTNLNVSGLSIFIYGNLHNLNASYSSWLLSKINWQVTQKMSEAYHNFQSCLNLDTTSF